MSLNYLKDILLEELDRKKSKVGIGEKINEDFIFTQVKVKNISGKKYLYVYSAKEKKTSILVHILLKWKNHILNLLKKGKVSTNN